MPLRMSGMVSGIDTDSVVQELMTYQRAKVTKVENKQTKLTWTQDIWKDLNKKLYSFYTGELTKFKTQGSYATKKVSSSEESKATATATSNAAIGAHTLEIKDLASAQYVTGGKISGATNADTKLTDLGMEVGTVVNIKKNSSTEGTRLEIGANTTIADFVTKCRDAGLNASFDATQKRLFISSKDSGKEQGFTIDTAISSRVQVQDTLDQMVKDAIGTVDPEDAAAVARQTTITKAYEKLKEVDAATWEQLKSGAAGVDSEFQAAYDTLKNALVDADKITAFQNNMDQYVNEVITGDSNHALSKLGLSTITATTENGTDANGMTLVNAKNAVIILDGAELEGTSNNFSVNGMTLDLKGKTEGEVKLNVSNDTQVAYDMVKSFVKKYNELLGEMNKLYGAKSARGYDPLTDEEKEAMTDDQIEKWESKIKDSLLRRDGTLSTITSGMRQAMLTSANVDGKSYSLASFGIVTSSDYTEQGLLHIYGDAEDGASSTITMASGAMELKKALEENPEAVMKVLSQAGQALYDDMSKKMERTSLSSALTFYNDKQMDTQQTQYKKQISELEEKLQDMEDRYYKQFSAMETALSKLQSQSNSLASMLGMGA